MNGRAISGNEVVPGVYYEFNERNYWEMSAARHWRDLINSAWKLLRLAKLFDLHAIVSANYAHLMCLNSSFDAMTSARCFGGLCADLSAFLDNHFKVQCWWIFCGKLGPLCGLRIFQAYGLKSQTCN